MGEPGGSVGLAGCVREDYCTSGPASVPARRAASHIDLTREQKQSCEPVVGLAIKRAERPLEGRVGSHLYDAYLVLAAPKLVPRKRIRLLTPLPKSVNCDFGNGHTAQSARRRVAGLSVPAA